MGNHVIQASLTGGEISPALYGRVDLAIYPISLATCRNFIVQPYGGVKNRAGLRMVCEVKDSSKRVRLLPFAFNQEQTYVLELGDNYQRVVRYGAQVAYASGPDQGLPAEIVTPYAEADLALLKYTQSADVITLVHPDHAPQQLGRVDHDDWTLASFGYKNGPFAAINTDRSIELTASATTGSVTIKATKDAFQVSDIGRLLYLEQKDFLAPWEVQKTIAVNDIRRSDGSITGP